MHLSVADIIQLISSVGFPIVVCGWLLYERYKLTQSLVESITLLSQNIVKMSYVLDELKKIIELNERRRS